MIEKRRLENEINSIVSNDALSAKMKIKLLKKKKQELLKKETKSLKQPEKIGKHGNISPTALITITIMYITALILINIISFAIL